MTRFITAVAMACAFAALAIPSAEARPKQARADSAVAVHCVSTAPGREVCPDASARAGEARAGRTGRPARGLASTSRSCLTADTLAVLERAEARFGVMFTLVSTCRPGARIAGSGRISEHAHGRAVDLLVPRGVSKRAVVRWLHANASGVTMVYRGMDHVHFDTGPYHAMACGGCGRKPGPVRSRLVRAGGAEAVTP